MQSYGCDVTMDDVSIENTQSTGMSVYGGSASLSNVSLKNTVSEPSSGYGALAIQGSGTWDTSGTYVPGSPDAYLSNISVDTVGTAYYGAVYLAGDTSMQPTSPGLIEVDGLTITGTIGTSGVYMMDVAKGVLDGLDISGTTGDGLTINGSTVTILGADGAYGRGPS